ncbi:hypothetical protein [Psychromonas aquimarina]|uniref:hypothetical protein n=1 Tax=Psychromonas aquimarina TaxID=444919 RepID=UPI0003F7D49C|nr:hypothetical protein [Psychromonas aquimarina]
MNRFITLILILSTLLTFTQKVTASAFVMQSNMVMTADCPMPSMSDSMPSTGPEQMDHAGDCAAELMAHTMDCQNDCNLMSGGFMLHFVEDNHLVTQAQFILAYPAAVNEAPYYFPESLYRPPFLS